MEIYSQESEESVIGALLIDNDAYDKIAETLGAHHFYTNANRILYGMIVEMLDAGSPVDVVTLATELETRGKLLAAGGMRYIAEIAQNTASSANIKAYAATVIDKSLRRESREIADEFMCEIVSSLEPSITIADTAAALEDIATNKRDDDFTIDSRQLSKAFIRETSKLYESSELPGLQTGLSDLDEALNGGLKDGDLVIIAGRPAMGKTVLATVIADYISSPISRKCGTVLFFSMEMSEYQLGIRQHAKHGSIDMSVLQNPSKLSADDWENLTSAVRQVSELKMILDFRPALTSAEIRLKAKKVKRQHPDLAAIAVDYIQIMKGKGETRNLEVGQIVGDLKALAKELKVPVIAISQLSRTVESRQEKRPMMSDLRDSGSIEQDADMIIFCYRDEYYNPDSAYKGVIELIIAKHRQGETKTINCAWQGSYCNIRNLEKSWQPELKQPAKQKWKGLE